MYNNADTLLEVPIHFAQRDSL